MLVISHHNQFLDSGGARIATRFWISSDVHPLHVLLATQIGITRRLERLRHVCSAATVLSICFPLENGLDSKAIAVH